MFTLRRLACAALALGLLAAAPRRAHAAFLLMLTQSGGNVVVNGSGTLNTTALTMGQTGTTGAQIYSSVANLYVGSPNLPNVTLYYGGGLQGPTSFGAGGDLFASAGTGGIAGIYGGGGGAGLVVPVGYVAGAALTDSSVFSNQTFATLGFTPGTYTYTWGTGANADSLTVVGLVPEPGTWALLGVGAVGLALAARGLGRPAR